MMGIVWLFLFVHLVVTIVYTLIIFIKNRRLALCRGSIVFLLPGIGLLTYTIMDIMSLIDHQTSFFDQEDLMSKIEKSSYKQLPNEFEELNVVPISEVLAINSNADKRRVLLDFLKVDHSKMAGYNDFMLESLNSGDTETTHYIASSLFEHSRERSNNLRKLWYKYENNPNDLSVISDYISALLDHIHNERLTEEDLQKYKESYIKAFEKLVEKYPESVKEKDLQNIVEVFMKFKEYKAALVWCHLFMEQFSLSEAPYVLKMDIYFRQKDNLKFTESLNDLMTSDINLSNSTWELIRYWSIR